MNPAAFLRHFGARTLLGSALGLCVLCSGREARAYRPFDGTDADVADVGVFELELGPAQFYRRGDANYVLAPSTVLNFGIARDLELVVDFKQVIASRASQSEARVRWLDTDVLLKWLMRRGSLQDGQGLSVALEAGPLVPEFRGEAGFGAQANLIVSARARFGTLHFNEEAALSRLGRVELFSSIIAEGPESLVVRPVAELFVERELEARSTTYSALFGTIWSAAETLSVDGALRLASEERVRALEVRVGFTWAESLWSRSVAAPQNAHASRRSLSAYSAPLSSPVGGRL
ncbi:MAG TPA: hypothetical protein VFQ35_15860 [Polyangiaceae bacterium]|nr:hypothetical protein [Polyangiaceae bacterium]